MTTVLQHARFQVVSSVDRSRQQLLADEANMTQLLKSQPWNSVIVYISGHGEGIDGQNYFVPISAPDSNSAGPGDLLSIAQIRRDLDPVASTGSLAIVLVDTCRSEARPDAHPMFPDADQAVLVNYSASPGQSAYAGSRGMSAWSEHFVSLAETQPTLGVDQLVLFANRYTSWQSATSDKVQIPVLYGRFPSKVPPFASAYAAVSQARDVPALRRNAQ
jgi:uncharacterized caspase-like protein